MIVAIEGIDGCGKATQAEAVRVAFLLKEWDVMKHDFPHYSTTAGGVVGRILRGEVLVATRDQMMSERDDDITMMCDDVAKLWSRDKAVILQSVMVADRLEHLPLLVRFAQSHNNLLVLDRYKLSGVAYGAAEGLEADWIRIVQSCMPDADLNILLDLTVKESVKRRPERRDQNERNLDKQQRVRDIYLSEFYRGQEMTPDEFRVVDGSGSAESITQQIVEAIWHKLASFDDHD